MLPTVSLGLIIAGFLATGLMLLLILWVFYDHRDGVAFATQRKLRIFHCTRCDHLFQSATCDDTAPCPRCGMKNIRLKL